ncbi:MAG: hypothetical protein AAF125_07785 [Chloroflexota bacterium]
MIRLTVFYNLPEGTNEDEYLAWRLGDHQSSNSSMEGVIRTDFMRLDETVPLGAPVPYRFMTIVEWPDRETYEKSFYAEAVQAKLQEDLKKIADPMFLIGEVLTETINETGE